MTYEQLNLFYRNVKQIELEQQQRAFDNTWVGAQGSKKAIEGRAKFFERQLSSMG